MWDRVWLDRRFSLALTSVVRLVVGLTRPVLVLPVLLLRQVAPSQGQSAGVLLSSRLEGDRVGTGRALQVGKSGPQSCVHVPALDPMHAADRMRARNIRTQRHYVCILRPRAHCRAARGHCPEAGKSGALA